MENPLRRRYPEIKKYKHGIRITQSPVTKNLVVWRTETKIHVLVFRNSQKNEDLQWKVAEGIAEELERSVSNTPDE